MQIRMLVSTNRNAHTINPYSAQALVISVNLKLTLVSSNLTTISIAVYAFGVSAAAWVSCLIALLSLLQLRLMLLLLL